MWNKSHIIQKSTKSCKLLPIYFNFESTKSIKKTNNVEAACVVPKFSRISKAINKSISALNEDMVI